MSKTWFITGASRGLGAEIAKAALEAGHNVVATARNLETARHLVGAGSDRLMLLPLDVTDPAQTETATAKAAERFGRIDVLVNNAGYGQLGLFEESSEEEIASQFETNLFGLMRVTRAVLPIMRRQRSGHIMNIGSIAGVLAFDMCTLYGATKFAVTGFSINLARELAPLGIHVTAVEPGNFRTDFLDASSVRFASGSIADYDAARGRIESAYRAVSHRQAGDPAKLALALVRLAESKAPPRQFLVGSDALQLVRAELEARSQEIDRWAEQTASADHDPA